MNTNGVSSLSIFRAICMVLLSCLAGEVILAQGPAPQPHGKLLDFMPASPSAAALGKFGDIPVGYCTGIPSISIPLYSYSNKMNGLNLNLSLDYHAGGIRVEEKASNVGMGWALNAGGVITRMLRGKPDETGYWMDGPLPDVSGLIGGPAVLATPGSPLDRLYTNLQDAEPDVFTFNFGGKTGRFVIGKNNQVYIFPQQQIKIQMTNNGNLSFTVVDDDGTTYVFDQQETAQYTNQAGVLVSYGNAWYPSRIIAPFGMAEIDFTYEAVSCSYHFKSPKTYFKCDPSTPNGSRQGSSLTTLGDQGIRGYQAIRIKKIAFPDGIAVNFTYNSAARCDVMGDAALSQVEITDGVNTRGFRLGQNYSFDSYTGTEGSSCTGLDEKTSRLVLHQVTEYSGATQKPPYIIQYNANQVLPSTFSFAQDHWGFYNGSLSNASLLPPDGKVAFYSDVSAQGTVDNADRTTKPGYAIAGCISQLTYPTGGYTSFTFESNDIPAHNSSTLQTVPTFASVNGMDASKSFLFTIDKPATNTTTDFVARFGGISNLNQNCTITVSITSVNGATSYFSGLLLGPGTGYTKSFTVTIPPGQYKCTYAYVNNNNCSPDLYVVELDWNNISLPPQRVRDYAGGLRISQIADYDGISLNPTMVKSYKYVMADGSTPSGNLAVSPVYSYPYSEDCNTTCPACMTLNAQYNVITSTSLFTLANSLGSPILYRRVEEDLKGDGNGNQGKTIREYSTSTYPALLLPTEGASPDNSRFPFVTPESPDWVYGKLLTDSVFDSNDHLKHVVNNTYNFPFNTLAATVGNNYFGGIKVAQSRTSYSASSSDASCTPSPSQFMLINQYFPYSGVSLLTGTVETDIDDAGNAVTTTTNYTYNTTYNYISKISTTNSKGDNIEKRSYYPYDYTVGGAVSALLNANMLTSLVGEETWLQSAGSGPFRMIGGKVIEYGSFNGLIRPSRIHDLNTAQPLDAGVIGNFDPTLLIRNTSYFVPDIQFDRYGANGNMFQQHRVNDQSLSYIWDYHNARPVAVATNAGVDDIGYTSFEADGTGGWSVPAGGIVAAGITGTQSYSLGNGNCQRAGLNAGATYIVSYWSTNGSYAVSGSTSVVQGKTVNGWTYYEHKVSGVSSVSVAGTGNIDELRLYPAAAQMVTYTFAPLVGMTSQCDINNRITYYAYDGLGRLQVVKDQDGNVIKTIDYHYKGQ